jgi:hypothetical protein
VHFSEIFFVPPLFFSSEELTSQHVNLIGLLIGKLRPHVCQGHLYQIFVLSLGFPIDNIWLWTSGDISYKLDQCIRFYPKHKTTCVPLITYRISGVFHKSADVTGHSLKVQLCRRVFFVCTTHVMCHVMYVYSHSDTLLWGHLVSYYIDNHFR